MGSIISGRMYDVFIHNAETTMPTKAKPNLKSTSKLKTQLASIKALLKTFCDAHLNDEYKELCLTMAEKLDVPKSPVLTGKANGWAAGIVAAIGHVNFLNDPSQVPHMKDKDIAEAFGISSATLTKTKNALVKGFDLIPFDPDFCLSSKINDNPMTWIVETESGMLIDLRFAPKELQEQALKMGIIPSMPPPAPESAGCCGGTCSEMACESSGCGKTNCGQGACGKSDCCQTQPKTSKKKTGKRAKK